MEPNKKVDLLRQMLLVRKLEHEWAQMYHREEFNGTPPALSLGQEAVSIGACAALEKGDFVFTSHRGEGPQIALGLEPKKILAEVAGKVTGYCKAKGNYHVSDVSRGVIGMGGIIGANAPIATGMALSYKLRGMDRVAVCIVGDGTANEGAVHEAANLAAIWELPVIFLIENNGYCVSYPATAGVKLDKMADRAGAYGMPGIQVDGNDVIAMYEAMAGAVKRARAGGGPTWIEAKTLRLGGHLAHDPQVYRSKEEIAAGWERDPIKLYRQRLAEEGLLSDAEFERMEKAIDAEVAEAVDFTRKSPFPPAEQAYDDLWA